MRRTSRRVAAGSLALGLLTLSSGLAWAAVVSSNAADLATRTLDTRAAAVQSAAEAEIGRYGNALRLVAAALAAVDVVDATAFDTATAPLDSMSLAGATSLAFLAAPVNDAGLAELQETWRARGSADLVLDPVEAADSHVFAVLSKPLDGSEQRRTGVDVVGAPAPYAALMASRDSGGVTISDAYQLIIDQELPEAEQQTSFSVTAPVVKQGQLVGWVLMGLRGQDFLGGVVGQAAEGRAAVALFADDTAGNDLVVASAIGGGDRGGAVGAAAGDAASPDELRRTTSIPAAQQTWTLDVTASTSSLIGNIRHRPLAIQVVSVIVALLVAGLWWSVASARARARAEATAATRDLATAEERARGQAAMLQTTVETIDEVGVVVVDADGRFLIHSRAAREMLGIAVGSSPRGHLGAVDGVEESHHWQEHYDLFSLDGSLLPRDEAPLVRALAGESTDDVELILRGHARPDGVRVVVSGRPIVLGPGRTGALAVFRDVTEERRQQAEQAAFSGMVAHDLKNPLTVVRGLLELATHDLGALSEPTDSIASYLHRSSAATHRMVELIDDLLALTAADHTALVLGEVTLGGLVRDTLAEVVAAHLAHRGAAGDPSLQPLVHVGELPTVTCDEERMRQVFANLIGNALKYVTPGTRPVVDVTAEVSDTDGRVRIFVSDRGIGIPERLRPEVVKPFIRTPTTRADRVNYPGTGLGLAICHRIIDRHGGTLRLTPNPGGGTIAIVELPSPRRAPGPGPAPTVESHAPHVVGGS